MDSNPAMLTIERIDDPDNLAWRACPTLGKIQINRKLPLRQAALALIDALDALDIAAPIDLEVDLPRQIARWPRRDTTPPLGFAAVGRG